MNIQWPVLDSSAGSSRENPFSEAEEMVHPAENNCESTADPGGDAHRALPTPFLMKTYQLVDDPSVDEVISWNDDGSTFVVWRPAEFARDVLPKYFKHNNFSSFVRQLNTYGFRKIVPDRWEFANDCFRKGEKSMLCGIHRRKTPPQANLAANRTGSPTHSNEEPVLPSSSTTGDMAAAVAIVCQGSGMTAAELLEENGRLGRDNFRMRQELNQLKSLCNNIFALMTQYANRTEKGLASTTVGRPAGNSQEATMQEVKTEAVADEEEAEAEDEEEQEEDDEEEPPRHGAKEDEVAGGGVPSPRLFGFAIGEKKRARVEPERNDVVSRIKFEALDPGPQSLWLRYRFQGCQPEHLSLRSEDEGESRVPQSDTHRTFGV